MKLILLFFCSTQLFAMERTLQRTFSINPAIDSLKCALTGDNTELMEERLNRCFPFALDRQYALMGLQTSPEAKKLLIETIQRYWYSKIANSPSLGLESLLSNLDCLSKSYELSTLEHSFKLLLTRLKRALQHMPILNVNDKLCQMVQNIPAYASVPPLTIMAARVVGQGDGWEKLPSDCVYLIQSAKQTIWVDPPFTH